MNKIMIVLSHNNFEKSVINKLLISVANEYDNVDVVNLYERYKGAKIGYMDKELINEDREKALNSDVIIYQFPFHWYTSPPMLDNWREWFLGWNWAYGKNYMLEGKKNTLLYTAGEVESDYSKDGVSLYDSDEFIKRFISSSNYCKMKWLEHFKVVGSSHLKEDDLEKIKNDYKKWLENMF